MEGYLQWLTCSQQRPTDNFLMNADFLNSFKLICHIIINPPTTGCRFIFGFFNLPNLNLWYSYKEIICMEWAALEFKIKGFMYETDRKSLMLSWTLGYSYGGITASLDLSDYWFMKPCHHPTFFFSPLISVLLFIGGFWSQLICDTLCLSISHR